MWKIILSLITLCGLFYTNVNAYEYINLNNPKTGITFFIGGAILLIFICLILLFVFRKKK